MNSPGQAREVGTLIVVVLKAKNLPNKRSIGKQDPYCSLQVGKEVRRIKPLKKGGQHPEWDEEVRFPIVEDTEDILVRTNSRSGEDGTPPPVPSKEHKFNKKRKMQISCYADDPREPELIGEIVINLEDVLTKGETDEWYTLMNKERYCGEIYLEMTFWSNARAPEKKTPRPSTSDAIYGGPGSFTPSKDLTPERTGRTHVVGNGQRRPSRSPLPTYRSANDIIPDFDRNDRLPEALRPSTSLAKLDLYVAPYESRPSALSIVSGGHPPYDEFGAGARRRESFPPAVDHRQASGIASQLSASQGSHRIPSASFADDMSHLSLRPSSSLGPTSGRLLPQATEASRPAFYESSYPSFPSSSSVSSHQSQPTGSSSLYPPSTSPSPMPQPISSGFVSPERADYYYNTGHGRTSVSPGHTGSSSYLPQANQPVYPHRTSDAAYYPPQAVTPIPAQPTYTQPPQASLSRDNSFSSHYSSYHQQTPPPAQQPQQAPYVPSTSPHRQQSIPSSYSTHEYNAPWQPQPQMSYQNPHNDRSSLPPPQLSNPAPYLPSTTPQPQTHYGNGQFGTNPSIPYTPQQPLEAPAPTSHSAPLSSHYDHAGLGGTNTIPSPTRGHGPRMSSSGSGRPLPNPQQHGRGYAHSQPTPPRAVSQAFGYSAPLAGTPLQSISGQFQQSTSFTTTLPVNGGLTPPLPAPLQTQLPAPPQQPISAYEQFQQLQQQHNPIMPIPEPAYANGGRSVTPQSHPPTPPGPVFPNPASEQLVYGQNQQQPAYPTYSSSAYQSIPPPPPLPSTIVPPPFPPPLPPTTPPYQQYQQPPQQGSYTPQPYSAHVPFSPPPPPPPLHS